VNEDKSTRYRRLQRTGLAGGLALQALALALLLVTGGATVLREAIGRWTGASATSLTAVVLFAVALVVLLEIVGIPMTLYRATVERRYGVSTAPLRAHGRDAVKDLLLGIVILGSAAALVYVTIARWPTWWWLISAAMLATGMILLARLMAALTPLVFACKPLNRPGLHARLDSLSSRAGLGGLDVYEWISDADWRRANAALAGTGRGRRVLLSDTLLADYTEDEIEVIVAHELGHHVHDDIPKTIVLRSAFLAVGLAVAALALASLWQPLGLAAPNDAASLPLLLLAAGLVVVISQPLVNAWSRRREYRADRYALRLTGRPDALVTALRRLAAQNLTELNPSTMTLWLFHSHPSIEHRIKAVRAFQD
jgi:STE24 endopeptidase